MDRSAYPLYSDEDYQTLFQTPFMEQNVYDAQTVENNHYPEQFWVPFHDTRQSLHNSIITDGSSTQDTMSHKDNDLIYPTLFNHTSLTPEQALNYSYYWHLLSSSTGVESGSSVRSDSQDGNFGSPFMTTKDDLANSANSNGANSSSLYSAMLKKGLNILPGFRKSNDEVQQPKPGPFKSPQNQRRNSYPNANQNPPTIRPSVSLPLDPISLDVPRKNNKKPAKVTDEVLHDTFSESSDSRLNNSVNVSCSACSKCTLNVNNDFTKTASTDKNPKVPSEKCELDETQPAKRKSKPKPTQSSFQDTSTPFCNGQESFKKAKPKTNQNKGKSRNEKTKSHRKRHSAPDADEPSPLVNLVFQLKVFLSQFPIQPLLATLYESIGSLMGMSVGLLWVFAGLCYEWAQGLFHLIQKWVLLAWYFVRAHGGSLISALFLRIPMDYYSAATGTRKSKSSSVDSNLPKTGEEAVQRLLKLKQTDPYSILGITSDATDEDIKRSYKSQAILVHPDKNHFPGAEEAFKILASAFEILGNPESRAQYDKENILNSPLSEASQEIADFLEKLKQNIEEAQSFLGCQNCGKTHRRYRMDRTPSEARYCAACKERHAAKEGDLWAETTMMGFKWHYYSYLDGAIYDVTEWVTCQPNLVSRVEANTHFVPCRLATPKNKSRSAAFSRMEDLKDLVNDLLNANQPAGADPANHRSAPQNGKTKPRKAAGGRKKK